jgi:hypothetical protein
MDNEETLPLLDAETQEKIAVAVHAIQKDYTGRLKLFTEDLPSLDPTRLSKGSGTPFAPRQPIAFKKLVTEYANDLFSIESSYYSEGRTAWKQDLANRVEQIVVAHVLRFGSPLFGIAGLTSAFNTGLTYHLSESKIRKAIQETLAARVGSGKVAPTPLPPKPLSASLASVPTSPKQVIDSFCDARGWSLDTLAEKAEFAPLIWPTLIV